MLKHTHRFQPKPCSPIINSDQLIQNSSEVMPFSFTCCAAFAIPLIPLCLLFGSFWAVVYLTGKQARFWVGLKSSLTMLKTCVSAPAPAESFCFLSFSQSQSGSHQKCAPAPVATPHSDVTVHRLTFKYTPTSVQEDETLNHWRSAAIWFFRVCFSFSNYFIRFKHELLTLI